MARWGASADRGVSSLLLGRVLPRLWICHLLSPVFFGPRHACMERLLQGFWVWRCCGGGSAAGRTGSAFAVVLSFLHPLRLQLPGSAFQLHGEQSVVIFPGINELNGA